ncbi:MAG TPA: flavin reductase family protein [Thermoleophilaceae bacterium]|nr:flavin reductase family protein [Thermoleophilaceae bacterium]
MEAFEAIVGALDYPMLIVTTAAGGERAGCLVGFATQCSIDPERFLVCVSDKNRTFRVLDRGATAMVVHVVPRDAGDLVELFGGETGDDADKFDRCRWSEGPEGIPVLDRCPSWFAGRIADRMPLGDHVGFVLDPFDGRADYDGPAFPFSVARQIEPGHEA